ncbi:hypothetical protein CPC08DRAFT_716955 [Agrocybe pediades]|nr:hypothetical protein CPC08DRAFT_716955 [Agrocybe pediades]
MRSTPVLSALESPSIVGNNLHGMEYGLRMLGFPKLPARCELLLELVFSLPNNPDMAASSLRAGGAVRTAHVGPFVVVSICGRSLLLSMAEREGTKPTCVTH